MPPGVRTHVKIYSSQLGQRGSLGFEQVPQKKEDPPGHMETILDAEVLTEKTLSSNVTSSMLLVKAATFNKALQKYLYPWWV